MKVYKVTLMVIDYDDLGAEEIVQAIETVNYPNDCISPIVVRSESRDIGDWTDEHPLNSRSGRTYFDKLFSSTAPHPVL